MSIRFRTMTTADIAGVLHLKNAAGWNQTEADWQRFLHADAAFVAEAEGRIVGTVATITYENRIAWIGMMLVDPAFRRQGIGEGLMRRALDHLQERKVEVIGLDATPMGQPLYERLGFLATEPLNRWSLDRNPAPAESESVTTTQTFDLKNLCERDKTAFGADRSRLITSFFGEHPERFVAASLPESADHAFLIARRGTHADHLAAWMADSPDHAAAVLDNALARTVQDTVIIDVPAGHPWAGAILSARGFRIARPLTRMHFASAMDRGAIVAGQCAILGPEFG